MTKERKYLKNPCSVCGQEQIGVHYHEAEEYVMKKKKCENCGYGYKTIKHYELCYGQKPENIKHLFKKKIKKMS